MLLAAVDHAAATGFNTHTWQLAWTLHTFLDRRGHWHDLAATQQAAVAAAGRLADPTVQARPHRLLAHAYIQLGRFDDAHTQLRHALDLHAQAGDLVGQANTHHNIGNVWERRGRHAEALHHTRQALDLYRATGHRQGQAAALAHSGKTDQEALVAFMRAERAAPLAFSLNPLAHDAVLAMVHRAQRRAVSEELRILARRVGVDVPV